MLASVILLFLLLLIVLFVGLVGALGVGAIGWVVAQVFALTQWQGTLVALGVTLGLGFLVYQLGLPPPLPEVVEADFDEWNDSDAAGPAEPPIVSWRQRRPQPADPSKVAPRAGRKTRK